MTIQDYIDLIPSENAQQPDFLAVITANVSMLVRIQELMQSMIPLFDLDLPPVGNQLDIIGQWVGVSRNIAVPIPGVFFTWDGDASLGWDFGIWATSADQTEITVLPDAQYLTLIKAKIAANQWDGTTNGAYAIWNALFTNVTILIQDFQNMSYDLGIIGASLDSLTLALITGGYIPLRPEGVLINNYFTSPGPVFAWDSDSALLQGWDTGLWATFVAPT